MRTRILASVTLWLAAVASIAAIAWLAIDAAGRQVTSAPIAAALSTQAPDPPARPAGTAPATTGGSDAAGPSVDATSLAAASPTTHSATSGRPRLSPTSSATGAPQAGAPVVVGTYPTMAGRIRVGCRGPTITLDDGGYAQPAPGWSVRVQSTGPAQVVVVFDFNNQQALLVTAQCVNGRPQFDQHRIEAGSPPNGGH